ncbi:MAG: hypothetical protein FD139_548, partial [Methylocystaceae bacterium]
MAERLLQPGQSVDPVLMAADQAGHGAVETLRRAGEALSGGGVLLTRENAPGAIALPQPRAKTAQLLTHARQLRLRRVAGEQRCGARQPQTPSVSGGA